MGDLILTPNQYDRFLEGTWLTVQVLGYSFVLGIVLSLLFGVARLSEREWVRGAALVYVEFARGISSIVLLFIIGLAVPILLDVGQAPLVLLASIALGLNMGGYGAEIVRGAIEAIPRGQTEATIALNLSPTQRLRHVILPQAMRIILPPMGNLTIEILKGTALISLLGAPDLLQQVFNLRQTTLAGDAPVSLSVLLFNALIIYFILAQVINAGFRYAERRLEARYEPRQPDIAGTPETAGAGG
ncbi:MAG: amino acid ABC transporter permease [Nitriliruptorales bacterium]|nr:amino acid ABC transporter permease [Nitriliruptorales bacterium]